MLKAVRLLGLAVSNLTNTPSAVQLKLFENRSFIRNEKWNQIEKVIDELNFDNPGTVYKIEENSIYIIQLRYHY